MDFIANFLLCIIMFVAAFLMAIASSGGGCGPNRHSDINDVAKPKPKREENK